jgi:hypothetical protein
MKDDARTGTTQTDRNPKTHETGTHEMEKDDLSAGREGIMFDVKVNLDSDRELTRCKEIVGDIHALFSRVWDEIALRTASSKLAHLRGRLGRITTEQRVQTEDKEKLCAELDRGIEAVNSRARFLSVASNDSTRASTSGFPGVTSTPGIDKNFGSTPRLRRTGRTSWGVGGLHSPVIETTNWPSSTS